MLNILIIKHLNLEIFDKNPHEEALQRTDMITSKMCVKEGEIPFFF